MSMRRHRVKATANLTNVKRKPRNPLAIDSSIAGAASPVPTQVEQLGEAVDQVRKPATNIELETPIQLTEQARATDAHVEQLNVVGANPSADEVDSRAATTPARIAEAEYGENLVDSFKRPAIANNQDDVFQSDIDDNVIQMDLQKSTNGYPMSPSAKTTQTRQRVRPTPVFGQRRNSFACASPSSHSGHDAGDVFTSGGATAMGGGGHSGNEFMSPSTPQRRERYYSGSSNHAPGTPQSTVGQHKYFPAVHSPGMGRIRTESICSTYSDYSVSGGKGRKGNEDQHKPQHQRVNARRDFETRFNNGVPDKSTFKMFDMIYYNPQTNPMEQKPTITTIKAEGVSNGVLDNKPPKEELIENVEPSAMLVPQLKLNANGEMIIDEKTLEIETTAEQEARKMLANSSLILMDENTGMNGFYKRQKRTRGWSSEETVRFYRALQVVGTDFSLMCQLFKERTRRDLKLKYKREERVNGALINKALLYPKVFNIEELKEQLDREREEFERHWQAMRQVEAEKYTKEPKTSSKAARALEGGNFVHENEHVTKHKLGKRTLKRVIGCKSKAQENNTTESHTDEATNALKNKPKRRRRQKHTVIILNTEQPATLLNSKDVPSIIENTVLPPFAMIKQEAKIKMENTHYNPEDIVGPCVLEEQLNELLEQPALVAPLTPQSPVMSHAPLLCQTELLTPHQELCDEQQQQQQVNIEQMMQPTTNKKTIINMDDGTYTFEAEPVEQTTAALMEQPTAVRICAEEPAALPSKPQPLEMQPDTSAPLITEKDDVQCEPIGDFEAAQQQEEQSPDDAGVSEHDIQQILTLLAEGSLVLVSTLDPGSVDNVKHEIYEMNPATGKLCGEPIDIAENIVQCILAVMS